MKTLLLSYNFLLLSFLALPLAMCSSDDDNGEEMQIPDDGNGDNEDNNNNVVPSDDITTLYLTNISRAKKDERLALIKGRNTPIMGNEYYYVNLGLADSIGIFSVTGGSYNTDNSFPTTLEDTYTPYSQNDLERNNVIISFVFTDETSANATLTINTPMTFETQSSNVSDIGGRVNVREIETGSFTIKAKSERLNDAIPPLGKDKDGVVLEAFKFNDEEISALNLNGLRYGFDGESPVNITHQELVDMVKVQDSIIPIKIIETALVQDGQRIEPVAEPPNF